MLISTVIDLACGCTHYTRRMSPCIHIYDVILVYAKHTIPAWPTFIIIHMCDWYISCCTVYDYYYYYCFTTFYITRSSTNVTGIYTYVYQVTVYFIIYYKIKRLLRYLILIYCAPSELKKAGYDNGVKSILGVLTESFFLDVAGNIGQSISLCHAVKPVIFDIKMSKYYL